MHCDNSPKDFIEARETGFPLVDKSMLIGSILNDRMNKVLLFCRPHCYGKSLNLSMLDAFLNVEHRGTTGSMGCPYPTVPDTTAL